MTDEEAAAIRARVEATTPGTWEWDGTVDGVYTTAAKPSALIAADCAEVDGDFIAHAPADIRALLDERAALVEIVQAMAALDLEYTDEHLEFFCPACHAFVSADWGSGRKPRGMLGSDWAKHRFKHEDDCPVVKARALLAMESHEA